MVGFEESSFVRDENGSYIYVRYQTQRRYVGTVKHGGHGRSKIEIINGSRVVFIGNKTFTLSKSDEDAMNFTDYKPEGYAIMKTPCFIHRAYLQMYFDPLVVPPTAVEFVNRLMNCEDILLSIMVTKFLRDSQWKDSSRPQSGVMTVKSSLSIKHLEGEIGVFL